MIIGRVGMQGFDTKQLASGELPDFFRDELCIAFRQIDEMSITIVFPIP